MAAVYEFDFEIKRSQRRKTLCLQIRDGQVKVMVPVRTPERQITALLNKHTPWIRRKLQEHAARPAAMPKSYVNDEIYTHLGEVYRLKIVAGPHWPAERVGSDLVVTLPARMADGAREARIKDRLYEWYRQSALEEFQARTECYGQRLGVAPTTVKVKSYKRRWGSCSAGGEITYNWRLVIAPSSVLDYVAAHEVAHLIQHNHSPDFWRLVEELMPDYRSPQAWLKKNGDTLAI
ncbi:MAG: SprT family zinc-dependent metalloprotease [Proteobacteria bacterium]|nr:SprT family zinc-dependent metalloprotease [Pseudomonadota bacterium]